MVNVESPNAGFVASFAQTRGPTKALNAIKILQRDRSRFDIGWIYTKMDGELVRLIPDANIKSEPKDNRYMEGENLGA